ncbi:CIA30 family protein [Pseudoalteromonas haloplanktis]|uniref:CIA30 family protein n=1 Tax=Pseudoalteromonas haloplanktis TaxID=228 RepID=A0ABU1B6Y7_PSEHA|nr:CIA30 family protein [Pseudoalteromonas haloplanktis]MDQ9090130.1 CIA30 family protein [Pseudoalteromonas haloplanktis]
MKAITRPITKTLIGLSLVAQFNVHAMDLRVDNVRVYQYESQSFSAPSSLYIDDGKIVNITKASSEKQQADKTFNAKNQFALPGLIDLHVHLGSSGSNFTEFQYLPVKSHFNANLYLGVTNIVDLFSFQQTLDEAEKLNATQLTPNLFYAGTLFTNPGGHGTQFGGSVYEISNDSDIDGLWQKHLATNPHLTKAVIETFGGTGSSLTDSQLAQLGERSKAAGLPYFVHVSTLADGKRAIKAGATALAHGINSEAIDDEFIALMKKNKVTYIPTLAVYHNHSDEKHNHALSSQTELLKPVPNKLQGCLFEKVPEPSKWKEHSWQARSIAYANIQKLHQAGVVIGTGSDAGNPYTLHGLGLHNEIDALKKAGLTNAQIIDAATINGAQAINQSNNIGQLATGFEASFILLEQNPIEDISAIHSISQVFKSGEQVNREKLIAENAAIEPQGPTCNKTAQSTTAQRFIDDFDGKSPWQGLSDAVMGGQSSVELTVNKHSLTINTAVAKPTNFGAWAGAEIKYPQPVDASGFTGVRLTYKGSTVPFALAIYHSDVKDWDNFSVLAKPSEQWRTIDIPFSDFKQFGFGNSVTWSAQKITGFNVMWRKMPGAANTILNNALEIKEFSYY